MAVGRLTVRNAAIISKLIESDTRCGFASPKVLRAAVVQGEKGGPGAVVWKVEGCQLDFPEETLINTDCIGVESKVKGSIKLSATKRVRGTLTGNPDKPVIPEGADAVTIEVEAQPQGFVVSKSDSKATMAMMGGALKYTLEPKLALSKSLGVCSITTLDLSFTGIRYSNGEVVVADESRTFSVDVPLSDFHAQVGKWDNEENSFAGRLVVWDNEQKLPTDDDHDGLDPAYTAASYFESVACTPDLATPVTYVCPSLREQVVHGAARLTVNQLGAIASLIDADTRCGFSSPAVLGNAQLSGTAGGKGSATLTIASPCTLSFAQATVAKTDCNGVKQMVEGSVTVTGTKKLTGVLSGDTREPVVPNSREPAVITLNAQLNDFQVSDSSAARALKVKRGTLLAQMKPRVALDTQSDICSIVTPVAAFDSIEWQDAVLEVTNEGVTFEVNVSEASLRAQSGTTEARSNYLDGMVISDGVVVPVPPAGASPVLDPAYDGARFESTFSCAPGYRHAVDDAACSVNRALATNAARLLMLAAGTLASEIQADTNCGFSALTVKTSPTEVVGQTGELGHLTWNVQNCRVGQTGVASLSTDCLGVTTFLSGTANLNAQRIVKGERDTSLIIFDSVIPRTRDALTLNLTSANLADFAAYKVPAGQTEPFAKLVLHGGTLSGQVVPALAERRSTPGVFDIGTPVATFTGIKLQNAPVTLSVAGKRFTFVIEGAQLSGLNGSLNGKSNFITGQVSLGGQTVVIPENTALDPAFTQSRFDSTYACTADLSSLIPP